MANEKRLINPNILLEWLDNIDAVNPQIRRDGIAHKYINTDTVREMIYKTMPGVDAVEVVRCKNCENRGIPTFCPMCYEESLEWDDDGYTEWDNIIHDPTTDDGFCDCGERRKDNV